uniref:TetR/AcrR family transcriptional regulator n=1 Tax=Ensifer adhaerens TaxID=106592 RepID=UPI003F49548A
MRVPSALRREQLVDATIEVMRENGVQSVTMREVAKRANASLAAVHYCFKDKDDLVHAAVERWLKEMVPESMRFQTNGGMRSAVLNMLEAWWDAIEKVPQNAQAQFELFLWAVRNSDRIRRVMYPLYLTEIVSVLKQAQDATGETCDWELMMVARSLLVIVDGCSFQYFADPEGSAAKKLSFQMAEAVFNAAKVTQRKRAS